MHYAQALADLAMQMVPNELDALGGQPVHDERSEALDERERNCRARERWVEQSARDVQLLPAAMHRHLSLVSHMSLLMQQLNRCCGRVERLADAATRHFQEACRQLPLIATGNEGGRARARRDFCSCMVEARHRLHAFKQNASPWLVQTEWHIRDLQHDADRMGAFEYF